jgi:hypothetical protein
VEYEFIIANQILATESEATLSRNFRELSKSVSKVANIVGLHEYGDTVEIFVEEMEIGMCGVRLTQYLY